MNNQNQESKTESPQWYWEMLKAAAALFAIIILVFTRRKIGVRLLSVSRMAGIAIGISLASLFLAPFAKPFVPAVALFAFAGLGLGIHQNLKRWREMGRGEFWHSFSSGVSFVELIPWPSFFTSHRRLYRLVEPAVVALAGCALMLVSHLLGFIIVLGAGFVCLFEQTCYEISLSRELGLIDSMLESESQAKTVDFYKSGNSEGDAPKPEDTAGVVMTGLSPDIKRALENRRAKKLAPTGSVARA